MKVSGNTIRPAPAAAASLIRPTDFSTVASRSRNTGVAWTAAAITFPSSAIAPPSRSAVRPASRVVLRERVTRPFRPLPVRNRRLASLAGNELRSLHAPHAVNVARAVGKHLTRPDAHHELGLRPLRLEGVVHVDAGIAVQPHPATLL